MELVSIASISPSLFKLSCIAGIFTFIGCGPSSDQAEGDLSGWLGEAADSSVFVQVDGSHAMTFPEDHGPHNEFMTEWWYITSTLQSEEGREFGVQFTVFRRALEPSVETEGTRSFRQVYMAHVALSDVARKKHYDEERISREHSELAGSTASPFRAFVEDWSVSSTSNDFFPLSLHIQAESFTVDLRLQQTKPIVLQGDGGYSVKSPTHASYYYSIPRMATEGSLSVGSSTYRVSGLSWMDREWSSGLLGRQYEGWYWFALSLKDGRDLLLFSLRDRETGSDSNRFAQWIEKDSTTIPIDRESWSAKPTRYWKKWPVEWHLSIGTYQFIVNAKFDNQEMNTRIPYWEGMVEIKNPHEVVGSGYMELTGY